MYQHIVIFFITLFCYIHIVYNFKISNEFEVFNIENPSKEKIEEVCELRQPVIFNYDKFENLDKLDILNTYDIYDINIRDSSDNNYTLPLNFKESQQLMEADKKSSYYSEYNSDFLKETGLIKNIKTNDDILRPFGTIFSEYDLLYGSNGSNTLFKYNMNFRNYIFVQNGKANIKLCPPKYTKYLWEIKDYSSFEFYSQINPWNVDDKYVKDFNKTTYINISLDAGEILYIPAYWWYSIQFDIDTEIINLKYTTFTNYVAILPHTIMRILQKQNTRIITAKQSIDTEIC